MNFNPIIPVTAMAIICILLALLKRKGIWNYIRHLIIVILIFVINLRPSIPTDKIEILTSNVDVLFVIDNTISMLAEDYGPSRGRRIDAVKENVETVMDEFEGARYSVITFADYADVLIPYTYERDLITLAVSNLDGQPSNYAEGTSLNISYDLLRSTLRRTERQESDENITETSSDRIQLVFFISDGEITNNERLRSFSSLAEYIDAGAVLGYGTTSGGYMRARQNALDTESSYVEYYNSSFNRVRAESKIDEGNLEDIASDLGVPYQHITKSSDINRILDTVQDEISSEEYIKAEINGEGYKEIYNYIAIVLAAFIIYDFIYYRNKMSKEG